MKNASVKKLIPKDTKELVLQRERALEAGKAGYQKADALLEQILNSTQPGDVILLGDGQQAVIVDNFATKNVVYKPAGVKRFDIKIQRAADITGQL